MQKQPKSHKNWQVQEAKNKFSEVMERAQTEGPQIITRRGDEIAVVLSKKDYETLSQPKVKLTEFFKKSPFPEVDLEVERSKESTRELDL